MHVSIVFFPHVSILMVAFRSKHRRAEDVLRPTQTKSQDNGNYTMPQCERAHEIIGVPERLSRVQDFCATAVMVVPNHIY